MAGREALQLGEGLLEQKESKPLRGHTERDFLFWAE